MVFPDPAFQKKTTILSGGVISWAFTLGHYLVPAYRLASQSASNDISFDKMWMCTLLYVFGVVIMLLADS